MPQQTLPALLHNAIEARRPMFDAMHQSALRLFNGFTEGFPELIVDLYGQTAVFHDYADPRAEGTPFLSAALGAVQSALPWIQAVLIKRRKSRSTDERRGVLAFGGPLTTQILEHGLWYAIDLTLHQDCTLYLDTRNLRRWAMENLGGRTALNAFSYTGSLGVAALGGRSPRVVHLDRSKNFMKIARRSYALNRFPIRKNDFVAADFFRETARLRRQHQTFDCVFLDPPFFSAGPSGVVDQEQDSSRLINKARPLVAPGGYLVAVNNGVYVTGADYMRLLEQLCSEGHMDIVELIPVPEDFIGWADGQQAAAITDPTPFNHSTKIAVLRVRTRPER